MAASPSSSLLFPQTRWDWEEDLFQRERQIVAHRDSVSRQQAEEVRATLRPHLAPQAAAAPPTPQRPEVLLESQVQAGGDGEYSEYAWWASATGSWVYSKKILPFFYQIVISRYAQMEVKSYALTH